jgi:hypothetical protein
METIFLIITYQLTYFKKNKIHYHKIKTIQTLVRLDKILF